MVKNMARFIVEFTIIPLGTCGTSASDLIAKVVKLVRDSGVNFQVTPMSTIIESDDLMKLFEIIKNSHELLNNLGIKRIITTILIDDRTDVKRTMADKVRKIEEKISS